MPAVPVRRLAVCILLMLLAACSYSSQVKKSMQRVLRTDFPNYHFFATPASAFGVGTMYLKSANAATASEIVDEALIAVSNTYFAPSVPSSEREALLKGLFLDGTIGSFSVSEKLARGVDLEVAVPGISGALGGSATLNLKKGVEVDLQAGEAVVRKLNWVELRRARNAGKIDPLIERHLDARDVLIAMSDIVVRGYTATVKIDATANAGLKAEFDKAVAATGATLPSGKVNVSGGQNGTYQITVSEPVVVAILFKEIPVGAQASADSDAWQATKVPADLMERFQAAAQRLKTGTR